MTHPTINFNKMGLLGPLRVVLTTYVLADDDVCNARMPAASYTIYIHLEWEISSNGIASYKTEFLIFGFWK